MARDRRSKRGFKRKLSQKHNLTKKQKSHWKQFGETHPADERTSGSEKYKQFQEEDQKLSHNSAVASSSSSEDEEVEMNPFQQLVSTFAANVDSSASSESEDDEEDEDDTENNVEDVDDAVMPEEKQTTSVDDDHTCATRHDDDDDDDHDDDDDGDGSDGDGDIDISDAGDEAENKEDEVKSSSDKENEDNASADNSFSMDTGDTGADPFTVHFESDLEDGVGETLSDHSNWAKEQLKLPHLGSSTCYWPKNLNKIPSFTAEKDLNKIHVRQAVCKQVASANINIVKAAVKAEESLTAFQCHLYSLMHNYHDIYFPNRNLDNAEELRLVYCMHVLNHMVKTRSRIVGHNAKIKSRIQDVNDGFRDQGLTRPKVLIVLPFRDSALRVMKLISHLLFEKGKMNVRSLHRFEREYSDKVEFVSGKKPDDFEALFCGNVDDNFVVGVGLGKKSLKLYTDLYSSDLVLASPLGLRTCIGAEGEDGYNHDFLSSIEVLIIDQAEVYLMQNWDHLLHVVEHLHKQPKDSHDVDFSRIRMWTLDGWSKFYRQTLVFSQLVTPEINALFNKHCHNYCGKIQLHKPPTTGSICQIVAQLPQVFHKLSATKYSEVPDARFEFFKTKILPQFKDSLMSQTLIYVPSYFDYVRLRNYMKREELRYQHICEYTNKQHMTRARSFFFHGKTHFMLYTERLHFFHRYKIRGIKHLIFYDLPTFPHFYSEMCNQLGGDGGGGEHAAEAGPPPSCSIIYSACDAHRLAGIVGTDRAAHMLHADKNTHMFVTGDT